MEIMKKIRYYGLFVTLSLAVGLLASSCRIFGPDYSNNHLTTYDLERHFVKSGIKIEQIQPLIRQVCRADQAFALRISGMDIGIYKYDVNKKVQLEKLSRMEKNGYIYIMAIKYPVKINGTFMMLGYHKNPEKIKIVEAFESFEL
jgi:hypothetical protein